jgi:hypothetical protein
MGQSPGDETASEMAMRLAGERVRPQTGASPAQVIVALLILAAVAGVVLVAAGKVL